MTFFKSILRFGIVLAVLAWPQQTAAGEQVPQVASGRIERLANFPSKFVAPRNVDVWLPPGYEPSRRYGVLYMHDGQMLFDARTTWNHQAWHVDEVMSRLIAREGLPPAVVVGIWNNGPLRMAEYFPQKALDTVDEPERAEFVRTALGGRALADAYLKFVVTELKPYIDSHYATEPDAAHTFIAGSSMGGSISVYALCEYPDVFGGAAALSVYWGGPFEGNYRIPVAVFHYLDARLPDPHSHRLYIDRGTLGLDASFGPNQAFAEEVIKSHDFTPATFEARVYDGATHDEESWYRRLDIPLRFVLTGKTD